ncbi:MAG: Gfo/Idh/MocA family oxidoreductase [Sedimentisphaerales bacterium]|nr:Gfo/Idh/MocA family oxidoreductase [Sedimentisphaerales bacterium]
MDKRLRTAVIGAGKMGRLHSRIYSRMETVDLVAIVDKDAAKAEALAREYATTAYADIGQILDRVDAVTVAVPTEAHGQVAEPFLRRSIPVLVEKPLAFSLEEAQRMLELARQGDCTLQVGYSERFNPVVQAMKRLQIEPRFMEAQRISPYTFRSTDVGVVLDLMIHDIDIMLSLARNPVRQVQAVGVNVLGEHEDIANVRLEFDNGCVANLTASRLALKTERKVRIFSEEAYLSLDYLQKSGLMISKAANIDMVQWLRQQQDENGQIHLENAAWQDLVRVEMLNIDDREPLELEQEAFVQSVRDGSPPQVSAEDAIAAMELAEWIVREIRSHPWQRQAL